MQYRLSKQAERNLEDLLIDGILTFGKIQREHRRFIHGSHVIFYFINQDYIVITTIVNGAYIKDIWDDI